MAKPLNAPAEFLVAVDAALDRSMTSRQAAEMFRYLLQTRAVSRERGKDADLIAARKLAMTRQQLNNSITLLGTRLGVKKSKSPEEKKEGDQMKLDGLKGVEIHA